MQKEDPCVHSLRDVSSGMLDEFKLKLDPVIFKRCKYVVEENERLLNACEALKMHDWKLSVNIYTRHTKG